MNHLSREAGVNKATIYQHFRSKEDIPLAAIARGAERTVDYAFKGAFEATPAPPDRLRKIHRRIYQTNRTVFVETATCRGCPFAKIGTKLATSSEGMRAAVTRAFADFAPCYRQIITDLKAEGSLTQDIGVDQLAADLQDNMTAAMVASKISNRRQAILDATERAVRHPSGQNLFAR